MGIFLERQAAWQTSNRRLQYNEVILSWTDALPQSLEAFFYTGNHGARMQALRAQQSFLAAYSSQGATLTASDYPVVALDLGNWHAPFSER